MRVLLTNDDGVLAPGIKALYENLHDLCDLTVVAPQHERSASGHGITIRDPLRVMQIPSEYNISIYSIDGTPVDCVKLAVDDLVKGGLPDLIISGINLGDNTGINVIYSGTVSAALEGGVLGIPSIAFSLTTYEIKDFSYTVKLARKILTLIKEKKVDLSDMVLNINVPPLKEHEIKDIVITSQGRSQFKQEFDKRKDPNGRIYYWLTGAKFSYDEPHNSDEIAVRENKVAITPLQYDLTDYSFLDQPCSSVLDSCKRKDESRSQRLKIFLEQIKK